ncbi:hypothetical protein ACFQQB_41690 [Nonomuraea rubra]|uniref:hypothetical protein n=1 Tax=Nonomuraea rubra TaxID=46180 RepID=UPI003611CE13
MSLARTLAPLIAGDVRDDPYTRHLYSSDASMYAIEPLAVAFPGTPRTCRRSCWRAASWACRCCRAERAPAWPARPSARPSSWTSPGT